MKRTADNAFSEEKDPESDMSHPESPISVVDSTYSPFPAQTTYQSVYRPQNINPQPFPSYKRVPTKTCIVLPIRINNKAMAIEESLWGAFYVGEMKNGAYDGNGTFANASAGSLCEGTFKDGGVVSCKRKIENFFAHSSEALDVPLTGNNTGEKQKVVYSDRAGNLDTRPYKPNARIHRIITKKAQKAGERRLYPPGSLWVGNTADGNGKLYKYNGDLYDGEFQNWKYHGRGCLWFRDTRVYDGEFQNGKMHGQGVMWEKAGLWDRTGTVWKGTFQEGTFRDSRDTSHYQYLDLKGENGEIISYYGELADNKPEGRGVMRFLDGTETQGYFVNGILNGPCAVKTPDNQISECLYNEGIRVKVYRVRNDSFVYEPATDDPSVFYKCRHVFKGIYDGQFSNNNAHGKGIKHMLPAGDIYDGEFVDNQFHGYGRLMFSEGSTYVGDFKKGLPWGRGLLRDEGYRTFRGDFVKGRMHGVGNMLHDDRSTYEGEFVKGVASGKGKAQYMNGNTYEGGFRNYLPHGRGKALYRNGDTYEGDFAKGVSHGRGTYKSVVGGEYKGDFVNGKRHGKGMLKYNSGDVYEGDFSEGTRHGKGIYKFSTGTIYKGEFAFGKRHGNGKITVPTGHVFKVRYRDGSLSRMRIKLCVDDRGVDGKDVDGKDVDGKDVDNRDADGKDVDNRDADNRDVDGKDANSDDKKPKTLNSSPSYVKLTVSASKVHRGRAIVTLLHKGKKMVARFPEPNMNKIIGSAHSHIGTIQNGQLHGLGMVLDGSMVKEAGLYKDGVLVQSIL